MKNNLNSLFNAASKFATEDELISQINQNIQETLSAYDVPLSEGVTIAFDDLKNNIVVNSASADINPLYSVIAYKCAEDVLGRVIAGSSGRVVGIFIQKANQFLKIFAWIFYVVNTLMILGVSGWVFSMLSSSDFRSWYYSELVQTDAVVVTFIFLILYPLILIGSTLSAYITANRKTNSVSTGRIALMFELPVLLLTLAVQSFIINAPLTDGLKLFLTFVLVAVIVSWAINVFRVAMYSPRMLMVRHFFVTVPLVVVTYFMLSIVIPFVFAILGELDIFETLSRIFEYARFEPTSILYLLVLPLVMFIVAVVLVYFLFRTLIRRYKLSDIALKQVDKRLSPIIGATVLVLFIVMLVVSSRAPSMGKYGELLILLAQSNDSYTTIAARAAPLVDNKEEVESRLYKEFQGRDNYMISRRDLERTNSSFGRAYMKFFMFPFIAPGDSGDIDKHRAYREGYERAYGKEYSYLRSGSGEQLKQVQHLSRDILVNADKSNYVAEVTITDSFSTFVNRDQEVVFEFSLPENAVVTQLLLGPSLEHRGQIAPRGAAQQVYTEQVRQNIDPALLEQVGPRQYRLRVYPVPANNDVAERQRNEKVEGEVQRVQFTYLVMRETEGIPLPEYSQKFNILSSETKYNVQLNGKQAVLSGNMTHVKDERTLGELCGYNKITSIIDALPTHTANLSVGNQACVTNKEVLSGVKGKKIQIFVDTSYINRGGKLSSSLSQLKSLPNSFYSQNNIELLFYVKSIGGSVVLSKPEDVPTGENFVFFGQSDSSAVFNAVHSDTHIVILLSGTKLNLSSDRLKLNSFKLNNKHVIIIHTPEKIPSYGPNSEQSFSGASSLTVSSDLAEALKSTVLRLQNPDDKYLYIGKYWYLKMEERLVDTISSSTSTVASTGLWDKKAIEKITARAYISQQLQTETPKDLLHKQAVVVGIVTPISSYIALVNQAQQDRLDKLSGDGDRYTSEARFQVTQPGIRNPISVGGGFGGGMRAVPMPGGGFGAMSITESISGVSFGSQFVGGPSGQQGGRGMSAPLVIFMILFISGVFVSVVFVVKRRRAKKYLELKS